MSNAHGSKWIRPEKRLAIYLRDGMACAYCGARAEDGAQLSLDHLQPRELGGSHDASNLVTCCVSDNASRQDSSMREWFAVLRDRGVDTSKLSARIRWLTERKLDISAAKKMIAARKAA